MTPEERGQLFVLETFYRRFVNNPSDFIFYKDVVNELSETMPEHHVIKIMGSLWSCECFIPNPTPKIKEISISDRYHYKLSPIGKSLYTYLFNKSNKEEAEEKLYNRKLELDVKNAERISKTYWWTFGFALAGFLISLVLAILKLTGRTN